VLADYDHDMASQQLTANRIEAVADAPATLDERQCAQMFDLFARHYRDVSREGFEADLAAKDQAIRLFAGRALIGFTTLAFSTLTFERRAIAVVFSGDTIVDPAHWGEQTLARVWLGQIGRFAECHHGREVYWFLIVKGHRTYRYLPTFARDYVPRATRDDRPDLIALRNAIAADRFGEAFDPASGVIRFAEPRGRLDPAIAEPLPRELGNPHVRFFLEANPGFRRGDELACLCALTPGNMRPRARRWFADGAT
jgi:hypothetical protein